MGNSIARLDGDYKRMVIVDCAIINSFIGVVVIRILSCQEIILGQQ